MAKNRLYYATATHQISATEERQLSGEGFFAAPKRKRAEKLAKKHFGHGSYSLAVTRVRLKDEGFLRPLIKAAKA